MAGAYCVTGASGYIGSWLIKSLLQRGYIVHATVRDPEKVLYFFSQWTCTDRLRLFQADMQVEGSFDEAVKGCNGVFHVAACMEFDIHVKENIDTYVQSNIINPAIKDSTGKWRPVVDESCQSLIDHVWNTKPSGWVYVLSKLLTEKAAFKFANENNIDLVSVITTTVGGPFLTPSVPSSIRVLLSPVTGDSKFFSILSAVNARMGSIALVHIEDICNAHIFLMENPRAEGPYICCAKSCLMSGLIDLLKQEHHSSSLHRIESEYQGPIPCEISSKKLRDLGFTYNHVIIEDIIHQTIATCVDCGFLPPPIAK
ncbi:hypothetical protein Dsin_022842 [Dipteronia sinensis]|uniref:NAD-dependent epimerase/dehydratase domain-containing protein n=1 Tax=Dipteronia sinensis TaxID=43782 RepID=A0AAE0A354_9ROSI|nr:hypothetical protein Dsin_022842 [Dipteronia sinensis]